MTEAHRAVIARLSADFASISQQLARVSTDLIQLDRLLSERPPAPTPTPQPYAPPPVAYWPPPQPPQPPRPYPAAPPPVTRAPVRPEAPRRERDEGWIGKLLAVAGVAVTLIGVVLLLVLAAQAGILRPEIRVAAGGALAAALLAAATWMNARRGGRVGGIALAATGIAAAYVDVIAVTTVYGWLPAPAGLVLGAVIGGGGLTVARRWNSQALGLLVLVPLTVLAPIVTGGITLLLVGFMLALSAASLPIQLGKDWIWLHAARIAVATLPLLVALIAVYFADRHDHWLAGACGVAALSAIAGALILLPRTLNRAAMALLTTAGVVPVLCVVLAVDRAVAAMMTAALAGTLLTIVAIADRIPGVDGVVRVLWAALSATSALITVLVAVRGQIAGPILLAMAVVVGLAGRRWFMARWAALGFAIIGGGFYLSYAPPSSLIGPTAVTIAAAVTTVIASLLLGTYTAVLAWSWREPATWACCAAVALYAATTLMVTAGMMIGGEGGGFFAGHMAATILWIATAAALFAYAARIARVQRSMPIGGGLALVAAAMAKLFLFDLGTLDGIFRVVVFIVVGLVLLGMGAGYARLLEKQDQRQDQREKHPV